MRMHAGERGATMVEFALVFLIFMMFLLSIMDFSRLLFTWNAAAEASRLGARYAVVCDDTGRKELILSKMQTMLPEISDIALQWDPAGCTNLTCEGVSVTITELDFQWISPIVGGIGPRIGLPTFKTYLPRENMRRDSNSDLICNS